MTQEHKIYKPKPISGFPEWLPEYRAVELQWMDKIRKVFESYGFCNIETPSVEEIDALMAKGGDTEKEIYTLHRLHEPDPTSKFSKFVYEFYKSKGHDPVDAENYAIEEIQKFYNKKVGSDDLARMRAEAEVGSPSDKDVRLALHFDLTVPMARYVAQHYNSLVFPFKRYQIQKSWRGERPQKGRFREFYQCDIDVINVDTLPLHFDAELPAVMFEAYQALNIPAVEIRLSNRKIIFGYLQGLGINDIATVTRTLDKLDKIGAENVVKILRESGLPADTSQKCLALAEIKTTDGSFADRVRALGAQHELLDKGLEELTFVMNNLSHLPKGSLKVDLSIIRGLDYYTGTILETYLKGVEFGAIGSGGRYDDLAGSFINQKLPGIGVSIGTTRLFAKLLDEGWIKPGAKSPTQVLVVLPEEARRAEAAATANTLRNRGYNVEMYHRDGKIKNQLAYAEKKGVPYVWFPPFKDGQPHEVKNMVSGEQSPADPEKWTIAT